MVALDLVRLVFLGLVAAAVVHLPLAEMLFLAAAVLVVLALVLLLPRRPALHMLAVVEVTLAQLLAAAVLVAVLLALIPEHLLLELMALAAVLAAEIWVPARVVMVLSSFVTLERRSLVYQRQVQSALSQLLQIQTLLLLVSLPLAQLALYPLLVVQG
jgi:hypothetical protein